MNSANGVQKNKKCHKRSDNSNICGISFVIKAITTVKATIVLFIDTSVLAEKR